MTETQERLTLKWMQLTAQKVYNSTPGELKVLANHCDGRSKESQFKTEKTIWNGIANLCRNVGGL